MQQSNDSDDRRSDYTFCVPSHGLFYDASKEFCPCHPGTITMGRLLNFAPSNSKFNNIKPEFFEFAIGDGEVFKTLLFIATRDIDVFEELRFDYGDKNCVALFGAE
jgi:hypothetical protein